MNIRKTATFLLCVIIVLSSFTSFAETSCANRGEVADMLLQAADFYNPGVVKTDIIKGYEDGQLHEERNVTRAEALVMLSRAFGVLPEPVGHNKRVALTATDFTDIPDWAKKELAPVFDSGIVAGTADGVFSPDNNVTKKQMELFIERVYSLYATNQKDDFYAAVNKDTLENMEIIPGNLTAGTIENIQIESVSRIEDIIADAISSRGYQNSPKQKIADFYKCIVDEGSRSKNGISPIKPYLDKIDRARNISELTQLEYAISEEICVSSFMGFSLGVDLDDSTKYVLCFSGMSPLMNKEFYFESQGKHSGYITYLETLLKLGGESSEEASLHAKEYFEFEKILASAMLSTQEQNDVNKLYTEMPFGKLTYMFPDFDLEKVLAYSGLKRADKVLVIDKPMTEKFAELYSQSNFAELKTAMKLSVLVSCGYMLNEEFRDADYNLEKIVVGITGKRNSHQDAVTAIQGVLGEYLSEIYVKKYFDEESKKDVEKLTYDIIEVFKKRIDNLSWMSQPTKEKAKLKLSCLNLKIGYPDSMKTYLDEVRIIPPENGGTYFSNMLAITKKQREQYQYIQFGKVNRDTWGIEPYIVNAYYNPSLNEIVLPAAILQPPLYDKNASYEEKLGGIGYVIAHEITHCFDSNGALFDEFGNMNNWWSEDDYRAFERLCNKVVNFFDGEEAIPAVQTNGKLTLNENIADLGSVACITQLAKEQGNLHMRKLYEAVASSWANTSSREYAVYASQIDPHSSGKIRVNRVLVNFPEFYEAFGINENDGMYVPPNERIIIW